MTLLKSSLAQLSMVKMFVVAVLLVTSAAQAAITPGYDNGRGGDNIGFQPGYGDGGGYGPVMPNPNDPRYGRIEREVVYVGRYVRNESIDLLRQISHLRGYRVRSVQVYIDRAREVNSAVDLMVNGRSEDSRPADVGFAVTLTPRSILQVGRLSRLDVYARGEMLVNRIEIQLVSESSNPPPYDDGREIRAPLNLPSYLPPQSRLDLTPYIDIRRYSGYTLKGIEVTAYATRGNASLDFLFNSFAEGRMMLSSYQSTQTIRSRQNLVIGSSFGNLVVAPRGDAQIMQVNLILSRY
jgi:hypothetical protein